MRSSRPDVGAGTRTQIPVGLDKMKGAIDTLEEGNILMNSHSLIASNSEDNLKPLRYMRKLVEQ
jgi:hypothetical protein